MEAILSIYLRDTNLENLPYVTGYCGEFGILQKAGPHRIPGMSESLEIFMYTITYHLSQAQTLGDYLIMITIVPDDSEADAMRLIVRQQLIFEQAVLLANVHSNRPLLHTPAVFDVQYWLTPSLDRQLSLEKQKLLDLHKAETVCLVSLCSVQLNWRLTFSPGLPMAPASPNTTLWVSLRSVVTVVFFFLAVFSVIMLLLARVVNDVK